MFLFHGEIIFCSRYSSLVFLTIPWFTKSVTSWWVLVYETGCIFQCLIQKNFGNIDFSWVSWVVLLTRHYNNIYSGLKFVLFICELENYKKDSLLIISWRHFLGAHSGWLLSFWVWIRHYFWMYFKTQSLGHQTWEIDRYKQLQ